MRISGSLGIFINLFTWIMRLTYLNLIWLFFILIGGVIFGFFPSTIALFSILRLWIEKGPESGGFQLFWTTFKNQFWESQKLGSIIILIGYLLYIDLQLFSNWSSMFLQSIVVGFLTILMLSLVFMFPVFTHLEGTIITNLRSSLVIGVSHWGYGLLVITGGLFIFIALSFLPALFFFVGGSLFSLWSTWVFQKIWVRLESRKGLISTRAYN